MRFFQVDVFSDAPFGGNPLAVFPDAGELTTMQMQVIAREMNLSETSFVTEWDASGYEIRIFTPTSELPFAGHPTLGTAWTMHHLGRVKGQRVLQRSKAGATWVTTEGNDLWFDRTGTVSIDLRRRRTGANEEIAAALGLDPERLGLTHTTTKPVRLEPALTDVGIEQLMVPVRDLDALRACSADAVKVARLEGVGAYCFTFVPEGGIRARGFFPELGIPEDPATGSAAGGLGLYLAERLGPISLDVVQGVEIGRPSRMRLTAEPGHVRVGGSTQWIFEARMEVLP